MTNTGSVTWTPTNGYELSYEVYNAAGKLAASHPVFTAMPSSVAPGAFGGRRREGQRVAGRQLRGSTSICTRAPPARRRPRSCPGDPDVRGRALRAAAAAGGQPPCTRPPGSSLRRPPRSCRPPRSPRPRRRSPTSFSLTCEPLPGQFCPAGTLNSGSLSTPYWTTSGAETWDEAVLLDGDQAGVHNGTSTHGRSGEDHPGGAAAGDVLEASAASSSQAFDPQSGNFTTNATDAAVAVGGAAAGDRPGPITA